MLRQITWTTTLATTYTAEVEVPDEWLGEGEVDHLDEITESVEDDSNAKTYNVIRTFNESHPLDLN